MWDILIGIALVIVFIGFSVWVYALIRYDLIPKILYVFGRKSGRHPWPWMER